MSLYHLDLDKMALAGAAYERARDKAGTAQETLRKAVAENTWPLLAIPYETGDIDHLQPIAEALAAQSDDVLIMGLGGSSLGGRTLCSLGHTTRQLHFLDTLDGQAFMKILQRIDLNRTTGIAISKSGETAETAMQTMALIAAFLAAGLQDQLPQRLMVLTEPGQRPLRDLAVRYNLPVLDHEPDLGGRFSVLSAVGLLPAMIAGVNGIAVRQGAQSVIDKLMREDDNPVIRGAEALYARLLDGAGQAVFMPYSAQLETLGWWYVQLVAESLGKGGVGITPIAALGPRDQHSALQLFLEGPADKSFTIISERHPVEGPSILPDVAGDAFAHYAGNSLGQLLTAECLATIETLARHGRPVRHFSVDRINENTVGALMMHFMLETVMLGDMLGVDPFSQPAVDEGKRLADQYLRDL